MAWPISHTMEAIVYAEAQIRALSASKLREAAIGWKSELREAGELRGRGFNVRKLPVDVLADFVSEHALGDRGRCTNGGWELYVDPDGFITVPFGPDQD